MFWTSSKGTGRRSPGRGRLVFAKLEAVRSGRRTKLSIVGDPQRELSVAGRVFTVSYKSIIRFCMRTFGK